MKRVADMINSDTLSKTLRLGGYLNDVDSWNPVPGFDLELVFERIGPKGCGVGSGLVAESIGRRRLQPIH